MKVLKKIDLVKRRQVARTKIERIILERAQFPFITKLHYAFQTNYRLYMIIDYMPGGDLFTHLSHYGVFTEDQLYLIPKTFSYQDAACLGTGYLTSLL